jgi:UDP-N-acetyl-D-galactosamine dehydrogenase
LNQFGFSVDVYDPHANAGDVYEEYRIHLCNKLSTYDAIILAVSHDEFLKLDYSMLKSDSYSIIFDTKAVLDRNMVTCRL